MARPDVQLSWDSRTGSGGCQTKVKSINTSLIDGMIHGRPDSDELIAARCRTLYLQPGPAL
jgi:hypothetical protein